MNEKMTAEKAIEQLNSLMNDRENHVHRDDFDDVFLQDIEACKMGIQALEKQVPKKVTHEATIIRETTCPRCKNVVGSYIDFNGVKTKVQYQYCSICGQALDWSD